MQDQRTYRDFDSSVVFLEWASHRLKPVRDKWKEIELDRGSEVLGCSNKPMLARGSRPTL